MERLYFGASKGLSFISSLIKWQQWGDKHTHVFYLPELEELDNPIVIEAWHEPLLSGGSVRKQRFYDIENDGHDKETKFEIFYIEVTKEQKIQYEKFLESKLGKKYDYLSLTGFFTKMRIDNDKYICSEYLFEGLLNIDVNLLYYTMPQQVSPALFIKSPLLKKLKV